MAETFTDDASRLQVPLTPLPTPLPVVGPEWCFNDSVRLRATSSSWLRSLTVKHEATREAFVRARHTLSATMDMNTDIEPSAMYRVKDPKAKAQVLTVERDGFSSTYDVHRGVFRHEDGPQPGLFTVTINSANKESNNKDPNDTLDFQDAATGESCRLEVDGDFKDDRVGLVRVRRGETGEWQYVARIERPKRSLLQAELFVIEIAAGMDALAVVMLWLARWGEFQREKPKLKSYSDPVSMPPLA